MGRNFSNLHIMLCYKKKQIGLFYAVGAAWFLWTKFKIIDATNTIHIDITMDSILYSTRLKSFLEI